ncbi:hypothetical protein LPJ61_001027 [Coemansia biformis]|uniref:SCP domain-containing protein n=1 Tax=Coemansia biformis TaxID=1286918 RepID=A0A9W8D127_9FUNG|nr:hypothetical protein LPJ61_001027 [Coemansia biformis]
MRAEAFQLLNIIRKAAGKPVLQLNDKINDVAQAHSAYQASVDMATISDPAGQLNTRLQHGGVNTSTSYELVAVRFSSAIAMMDSFIDNPDVKENLLCDCDAVGFGYGGLGYGGLGYGWGYGWSLPFASSSINAFNANNNFAHFNDDTLFVNNVDSTVSNSNVNAFNSANVVA